MTTAADWLVATLAEAGVEVMFGNPGSTELPLIDALGRQERIRYVLGLHEASVLGIADGHAQHGRRLSVVNVHVQPGLANAMSGILNAARARVPMLVTVGQQVTSLADAAPFLGGELVAMAAPIAKGAWEVTRAEDLAGMVGHAIATALSPPCGPVVLSLPMDVLAAPASAVGVRMTSRVEQRALPNASDATRLLAQANAPAVLVGDGVAHADAGGLVAGLAERIGAPIYGEPFAARQSLPSRHPLWRGQLPGFAAEIRPLLEGYDVIVAIGMPVFRLFGDSPGPALPPATRLIHLDVDPDEIGRTTPPAVGLVAPIDECLTEMLGRLPSPVSTSAAARRHDLEHQIAGERTAASHRLGVEGDERGVTPTRFCLAVAAAVGPDDLVVDEALTSGRWLRTALIERNDPDNWLAHRGSALGWGLPAAVGAKLADPARRVMCVHGDGSFLFGVHALWTAAHERLGVAVVVADNSGYEILRAGLEGLTGNPAGNWPGLALTDPAVDLVEISRGFGATAERVTEPDGLDEAFQGLWRRAEEGPAVLVVPVTGTTPAVGYPL